MEVGVLHEQAPMAENGPGIVPGKDGMATIKDVAGRAGVSTATVSYVINKSKFVSTELVERVLRAIKELNYLPSALARGLRVGRTMTLGLLMDDISNRFGAEFTRGLEDMACRSEYSVIISDLHKDMVDETKSLDLLLEKQVDGIIYSGYGKLEERLLHLWEGGLPVIAVDKPLSTPLIPSILVNHKAATTFVLEYLRDLGHSHIVYVAGLVKNPVTKIRADAFKAFMHTNRLDGNEPSIQYGDYSLEHGYQTARRLFEKKASTTAIYCGDDLIAFGVIAGLKSRGVRVPHDISVVSFGNDPIAQYFDPPLTTVDYPMSAMGGRAFSLFRSLIGRGEHSEWNIVLPTELVVRQSAARPPA
jgi:LacI family transcriptional regulator